MKFSSEVIVDRPREQVLDLIMAPGNFSKWQPGVKSFQLLSGVQGQPGARAKVAVDMYGVKMEMTETIVERRMPDVYTLRYDAKGVKNVVENRFYEDGPGRTRWVMNTTLEFSPLTAVAAGFIKDIIVKQNHQSMQNFKAFAEQS
jgi:carbon monoxide dehydrogenase subunit G